MRGLCTRILILTVPGLKLVKRSEDVGRARNGPGSGSGGCRALGSGTVGRELNTSEATRMHRMKLPEI